MKENRNLVLIVAAVIIILAVIFLARNNKSQEPTNPSAVTASPVAETSPSASPVSSPDVVPIDDEI